MSKTPEDAKREILEEFDKDTACFDIASSCRPEISRLISTALDRYGEAVSKEWANKKCEQLFLTLTEGKTVDQMKEAAVAQERERVKEWACDYTEKNAHDIYLDDLLDFLSHNTK